MGETTVCQEVAAVYAQFPWLEEIYPQAKVDCAHVKALWDVGVISNASAYLVYADGTFSEIALRVVCRPLWSNAFLVDSKIVGNLEEDIRRANQAVSAVYAVLIQHLIRDITVFELENV